MAPMQQVSNNSHFVVALDVEPFWFFFLLLVFFSRRIVAINSCIRGASTSHFKQQPSNPVLDFLCTHQMKTIDRAGLQKLLNQRKKCTAVLLSASAHSVLGSGSPKPSHKVAGALLREGMHVPAIRPPTVPKGTSRLRVSLSAAHSKRDIEMLAERVQPYLTARRNDITLTFSKL